MSRFCARRVVRFHRRRSAAATLRPVRPGFGHFWSGRFGRVRGAPAAVGTTAVSPCPSADQASCGVLGRFWRFSRASVFTERHSRCQKGANRPAAWGYKPSGIFPPPLAAAAARWRTIPQPMPQSYEVLCPKGFDGLAGCGILRRCFECGATGRIRSMSGRIRSMRRLGGGVGT